VRQAERDIQREVKRWRVGVRGGAALDPELFTFGVHTQLGPVFSSNVFFRPNAEYAFGEITNMVALNLEAIYRLPTTVRRGTWRPYVGAGPSFNFLHQNFERKQGEGRDIDFGDFSFSAGFNILGGFEFRNGVFTELKTSLYAEPAPVFRLIVGYNF
jgi:hypothetical protein